MKVSKYIILFERGGLYFLYNTQYLSLLTINKSIYDIIKKASINNKFIETLDKEIYSFLLEKGILDDDNNTNRNDLINKMKYLKRLKSFTNKTLSLVIAPTLTCNFACPYCYEANLPLSIMNEKVEDKIIEFINSFEGRCDSIELCWEGGEPLLAFERIKTLYNKIKKESHLPIIYHSLITNGYLLSDEIVEFLSTANINFIQITIDGKEETHNKSRILKSGKESYNQIINNVDLISNKLPDCLIVIRTNIHEGNKDEFGSLYKELSKRWADKKVKIFPAFVMPNSNCKVTCCTPVEKTNFFINLKRNENITNINFLPRINIGSCSATSEYSYIIDPDGNIYKCWNDIGLNEKKVGDIFNGITNNTLIAKYMVGSDKYGDSNCLECSLFPICDGGCNRHRMDNLTQYDKYPLCPFTIEGIQEYLYEHYKLQTEK